MSTQTTSPASALKFTFTGHDGSVKTITVQRARVLAAGQVWTREQVTSNAIAAIIDALGTNWIQDYKVDEIV